MPSEDLARVAVTKLQSAFGNVSYLTPTAFLIRNGEDVTGSMYQKPRSANVCHLGVSAEIKMRDISHAFDDDMRFTVDYFLLLPQSFGKSKSVCILPSSKVPLKTQSWVVLKFLIKVFSVHLRSLLRSLTFLTKFQVLKKFFYTKKNFQCVGNNK